MPRKRQKRRKHRIGRPTKYSPAVCKRICKAVAEGCSREAAASLGGISKDTLNEWQRRIPAFYDRLQKADAVFERACIAELKLAPKRHPRNWAANAWLLERKFPERYGKIERHLIKSQTTRMPMPQEYIDAINRALGITGKLIPIHRPPDRPTELPVLPQGEAPEPEREELYLDGLPILPQGDEPIQ